MVDRVWYKPPEGKLVPFAPGQMAREYFPPEGNWTPRTQYIERMLARKDGTEVPGGDEAGLAAGQAKRAQEAADREAAEQAKFAALHPDAGVEAVAAAKPTPEERMAIAKEKLGYTAPMKRDAAATSASAKTADAGQTATSERK